MAVHERSEFASHPGSLDEIPLPSGRLTRGVVRIGDTVRRPSKASSPFVRRLLGRLGKLDASWAPRYLGQDSLGRDVLTFLPGSVPLKWRTFSNQQVSEAGRLLRRFHDATRGSDLAADSPVVCHNDPGPNNLVFQDDLPFAFIDFDTAAPGHPLDDLGYMAWAWCISSKPDRQSSTFQAAQVRVLVDAYGLEVNRGAVVPRILGRVAQNIHFWSEKLTVPESTAITVDAIKQNIEWSKRELAYARANCELIAEALR
jgi:Ser/Thr protein kinase RdoA (MazF antagonist)